MFLFQTPRHYGRKWEAPRHRGSARAVSPSTWINDRATGCRNPPPPIEAPARHGSNDQPQSVTRGAQSASGQPPDGQRTAGPARSPEHPRTGAAAGRATHSRPCTKPRTDQPTRYGPQPLPSAADRIGVGKRSLGQAIHLPQCSVAYPNARNMPQYGRRAARDGTTRRTARAHTVSAPGGPRERIQSAPPVDGLGPAPARGPGPGSRIRRSGAHSWKLMPKSIEPSVSRKSSDTCPSWKSTSE